MKILSDIEQFLSSSQAERYSYSVLAFVGLFFIWTIFVVGNNFRLHTTSIPTTAIEKLPDISAMHLFGTFVPTVFDLSSLPETTLNITLVGTFVAQPEKYAQADIISDGQEANYSVGDSLPGAATIMKILPEAVVLQHNGRLEILSLPKDEIDFGKLPERLNLPTNTQT